MRQILFNLPQKTRLADTGSTVIANAGVCLCYGSTELIEDYGFIAVAVMGLSLRRIESGHAYHRHLHDFSDSIEHALTAILLIALGSTLPALFADLSWRHVIVSAAAILLVRPVAGWLSLRGPLVGLAALRIVAAYGVCGIGSIYYLAYAASHAKLSDVSDLWVITGLTIFASTVLHGFTVGWAMEKVSRLNGQAQ